MVSPIKRWMTSHVRFDKPTKFVSQFRSAGLFQSATVSLLPVCSSPFDQVIDTYSHIHQRGPSSAHVHALLGLSFDTPMIQETDRIG